MTALHADYLTLAAVPRFRRPGRYRLATGYLLCLSTVLALAMASGTPAAFAQEPSQPAGTVAPAVAAPATSTLDAPKADAPKDNAENAKEKKPQPGVPGAETEVETPALPTRHATRWTMPPSVASRRPDLFLGPLNYSSRNSFYVAGAADLRYRTLTQNSQSISRTVGTYIAASRVTAEYIRANPDTGDERGGVRLQVLAEPNRPDGTAIDRLRPSEMYGFYNFRFPGVSATVRAGQFVLPFGLIAVYDTPLQPIQPLYEKSLGLRVDTGFMLEGDYGLYHYAGAITTGAGPNRMDPDANKVVSFRLSRTLDTKLGLFQVGGSLLTGKLPKTGFETELLPSGSVVPQLVAGPDGHQVESAVLYVNKTRFAGDGEYRWGKLQARGEIVFGGDDDSVTQAAVWGYFGEGDYQMFPHVSLTGFARSWNFPIKPQRASTLGFGANFDLGNGLRIRSLFEYERDVPPLGSDLNPTIVRRITLQTQLAF